MNKNELNSQNRLSGAAIHHRQGRHFSNPKRLFFKCAIAFVILLVAALAIAGNYMVNYALRPSRHGENLQADWKELDRRIPGIIEWGESLKASGVMKDTFMVSRDGYRLHAVYAPYCTDGSREAAGTAILVHGYTCNHQWMYDIARMYRDSLHYNIFLPDLHWHGLSEGKAVRMGWKDRLDVKDWLEVANGIFGGDFYVIHGVSMGAATTMMLSGESDVPEYVKAYVEDCGYSTVWVQFIKEFKEKFDLPARPIVGAASVMCRLRFGWGFRQASSLRQLEKCDRPMLFIHGEKDVYVPTSEIFRNYSAKTHGYKEMWISPDNGHNASFREHPAEYTEHVRNFLAKAARQ
ncbi:MAG: alpha/beta hydrolase [Bacteroidales bacterium]|nr:alpha/beta hydrolase [Bacteroidales bacterium]